MTWISVTPAHARAGTPAGTHATSDADPVQMVEPPHGQSAP
jgi:hypothetical protein